MANYLIIARSARALVASAKRGGHEVHAVDCFVDEDTKELSDSVSCLRYEFNGFVENELFELVKALTVKYPDIIIIIGTGFEARPEQIEVLRKLAPVISNATETITRLKNPACLNSILLRNSIKHPFTSMSKPKVAGNYLIKEIAGVGGTHIRHLQNSELYPGKNYYYQEFISGNALSVLFLANGKEARLVGVNQQIQTNQFEEMPFLYQGAVTLNPMDLNVMNASQQGELVRIVDLITNETGLSGLCGLDFILDAAGSIYVLEVNPRPPATFELHERGGSLVDAHSACFEEQRIDYPQADNHDYRACAILYARQDLDIVENIQWPDWVKDRPSAGESIARTFPVCTVYARENSHATVTNLLARRLNKIELTIVSMQNAA